MPRGPNGIKVFYYILPKVWASKEGRLKKLKLHVDRLYSIMPFEVDYFKKHGIDICYCGNPIMDAIENRQQKDEAYADFCRRNGLDGRPKIALVAGSRQSELKYNLPEMLRLRKDFSDYEFVIAGAPSFTQEDYKPYLQDAQDVKLLFGETYQLMSQARAAVVTSGTATLETALLGCPQIVLYLMWGGAFSDFVAHLFIKVKHISLVNLILGREAVIELFQKKYTYPKMKNELASIVEDGGKRAAMLNDYNELRERVGHAGCSDRAATDMISTLCDRKD